MDAAKVLLLPLAGVVATVFFRRRSGDLWDAVLKASLLFVWTSFALSEALGAGRLLAPWPLAAGWCLSAGLGLVLWLREAPRPRPALPKTDPVVAVCLAASALIALITLCLALGLPQWNVDSQLYHLPRVEQWVQNRSLALFPTPYDLQDFFPPGAEFLSLQFRLLSGSAVFSGLMQWCAFLLTGLACAATVRALGGGSRAQALGALAWTALPMALLQSSTAQSDVAAAYGAALTAYFAVRHDREPGGNWDLWAAAAAGAALMLKGTDYLFVPAFGVWIALRRDWRKPQAARLAALLALALLPSLPYWFRNLSLCGSPLGSSSMHFLKDPGPAAVLSNALKGLGDELRFPSLRWNAWVVAAVSRVHAWLGIPLNNPDWVFTVKSPYGDRYAPYTAFCAFWHEDYAGAPLQILALLALGVAVCRRPSSWAGQRRYLSAVLGGALSYFALVRWNLFDVRLTLPLFALAAAPLGVGLARARKPVLLWAALILLAAQGLWAACDDQGRPLGLLFSPQEAGVTLAAAVPGIVPGFQAALRGPSIGLLEPAQCCPADGVCEYGVWLGARDSGRPFRIQHLLASPATAALLVQAPWNGFKPDVIVADERTYTSRAIVFGHTRWLRLGDDRTWAVYLRAPAAAR